MCFNKEVSITTYIIGMLGSLYLYNEGHIPEAFFYGWVIQMQLIEFILWKHQECNNLSNQDIDSTINKQVTRIGILINHLEPIVLWLAIIYFSNKKIPHWVHQMMLIYIILTVIPTTVAFKTTNCTTITKDSGNHLYWEWNDIKYTGPYYMFFLATLIILSLYGLKKGIINATVISLAFVISIILYYKTKTVGAMWCFIAAFVPWILPSLYKMV